MNRSCVLVFVLGLLAGCSGGFGLPPGLNPFSGEAKERSREPQNAVAYRCDGGRRMHVRMLENGAAAWLILPEREMRLEKSGAAAGTNYSYRGTLLEIKGSEAALFEGSKPLLTGCKTGAG